MLFILVIAFGLSYETYQSSKYQCKKESEKEQQLNVDGQKKRV